MNGITIKKANGELIELDGGQVIDEADMRELLGEPAANPVLEQLVKLVEELKSQRATPPAEKKEWRRAQVRVAERDGHGRAESFVIEKS
jgi:hypothetical protein